MSKLDYSLPLSDLVRESTKEAHNNVEHSATAVALLRGDLSVQQYTRFLMMLWHMYE
jgi:heme oxygenase (biliverdin-producing, ferredoxin)